MTFRCLSCSCLVAIDKHKINIISANILYFHDFYGQMFDVNFDCFPRKGILEIDQLITVLLSTGMFVGGVFALILDNTIPGTLSEEMEYANKFLF